MVSAKFRATVAAVPIFSSLVSALDVQSKTNVAVYYGQGANQKRLSHFCQETSLDIINLGFINIFPDQGLAGLPGSNFGNQCDGLTFTIGGLPTQLLSGCNQLIEDIPKCQAAGKIVLLSLGGATPANQEIESEESAIAFADFLWGAFGPKTDDWIEVNGPRPFDDVVVDGFDFDIEHNGGFGYATMINRLRWHFAQVPTRKFYISGAPQCLIPDQQLSDAIQNAAFDFIWVQFYNTDGCSARDFVEGTGNPGFNFDQWADVIKKGGNPSAKLFVGLPASPEAANPGFYLSPDEVRSLITKYMGLYPQTFGGVMLWEATASDLNQIDGGSYADNMKNILNDCAPPVVTKTHSSTSTISSTPASSSIPTTPVSSSTKTHLSTSKHSPTRSHSTTPASPSLSTTTMPTPTTSKASFSTGSSSVIRSSSSSPFYPSSSVVLTTAPPSSGVPTSSSSSSSKSTPVVVTSPASGARKSTTSKFYSNSTATISQPGPSTRATSFPITSEASTRTAGTTPSTSSSELATVTTVIVTSYIDICPTGFTTITTTYTTTYCPGTVSATTTPTPPPTGPVTQVPAPPPPEGWTTTVTVCYHCAPTPTTVTLTLPCATTTEAGSVSTTSSPPPESAPLPGEGVTKSATTTKVIVSTVFVIPVPPSSGFALPTGTGALQPTTFSFLPSTGGHHVPVPPSSSQSGPVPVFTGAASRSGMENRCVAIAAGVVLAFALMI